MFALKCCLVFMISVNLNCGDARNYIIPAHPRERISGAIGIVRRSGRDVSSLPESSETDCGECLEQHGCLYCRKQGCSCDSFISCKKCLKSRECEYCSEHHGCQCDVECSRCLNRHDCLYCREKHGCKCQHQSLEQGCSRQPNCQDVPSPSESRPIGKEPVRPKSICKKCFEPRTDNVEWEKAEKLCKKEGYKLASVRNSQENEDMIHEIKKRNKDNCTTPFWIAGRCTSQCNNLKKSNWYWTDTPDGDGLGWDNWDANSPYNNNGNTSIYLMAKGYSNEDWGDYVHAKKEWNVGYMCERPCDAHCEGGPKELQSMIKPPPADVPSPSDNRPGQLTSPPIGKSTPGNTSSTKEPVRRMLPKCKKCFEARGGTIEEWGKAVKLCENEGYKLASVRNSQEHEDMMDEVWKRYTPVRSYSFWIAARCTSQCNYLQKSNWYWTDTPDKDGLGWDNWDANAPLHNNGETSTHIFVNGAFNHTWDDSTSGAREWHLGYMCERPCHYHCEGGPKELQSLLSWD